MPTAPRTQMICTNVLVEKILLNSVICVPSRDRISFVLDEQQDLATMAQSDSKLDRLLPQRTFGAFRELRNLGDGRLRFRMSAQLFHIRIGVFAARDNLLRLSHSMLLICGSALLAHTNTLASCISLDLWRIGQHEQRAPKKALFFCLKRLRNLAKKL